MGVLQFRHRITVKDSSGHTVTDVEVADNPQWVPAWVDEQGTLRFDPPVPVGDVDLYGKPYFHFDVANTYLVATGFEGATLCPQGGKGRLYADVRVDGSRGYPTGTLVYDTYQYTVQMGSLTPEGRRYTPEDWGDMVAISGFWCIPNYNLLSAWDTDAGAWGKPYGARLTLWRAVGNRRGTSAYEQGIGSATPYTEAEWAACFTGENIPVDVLDVNGERHPDSLPLTVVDYPISYPTEWWLSGSPADEYEAPIDGGSLTIDPDGNDDTPNVSVHLTPAPTPPLGGTPGYTVSVGGGGEAPESGYIPPGWKPGDVITVRIDGRFITIIYNGRIICTYYLSPDKYNIDLSNFWVGYTSGHRALQRARTLTGVTYRLDASYLHKPFGKGPLWRRVGVRLPVALWQDQEGTYHWSTEPDQADLDAAQWVLKDGHSLEMPVAQAQVFWDGGLSPFLTQLV